MPDGQSTLLTHCGQPPLYDAAFASIAHPSLQYTTDALPSSGSARGVTARPDHLVSQPRAALDYPEIDAVVVARIHADGHDERRAAVIGARQQTCGDRRDHLELVRAA